MKISEELQKWMNDRGLVWYVEETEHHGCWGKGCSHTIEELHIRKAETPNFGWSFENGCSDKMIIKTLSSRL